MENKRILLKISGEVLGSSGFGLDADSFLRVAEEIKEIHDLGFEIAVVVGGGNIIRGIQSKELGIDRVTADYMGMVATLINSIYLQAILERKGKITRVMSAIEIKQIAEPYIRRRAIRHLEKGRIVIFATGTGNPFFSTDTAAALRAVEISARYFLKGTKVDGIYSKDPVKNKDAIKYDRIDYDTIIKNDLKILDASAVALCKENNIEIIVFNITKNGVLKKVLFGERLGTLVTK
ncbi:MAG: UMP kinase [Candidatus Hydrothermales bacterium]